MQVFSGPIKKYRNVCVTYILRRYFTLQLPRKLMKALLMASVTPTPCTRFTVDDGRPTLTICMLGNIRQILVVVVVVVVVLVVVLKVSCLCVQLL